MTTELITLPKGGELVALSTETGVNALISKAEDLINNLDGGNMETKAGRKKIRSNAFKATKFKTAMHAKADELIATIEKEIQPKLDIISGIKSSKKILGAGLDKLKKDTNEAVQAKEDEIQKIADELAIEKKIEADKKERDRDHELATYEYKAFLDNQAKELALKAELEAKEAARIEMERLDREEAIRIQAAEDATVEAERLAQKAIDDAQAAKQQAIDDKAKAEREAIAAIAREELLKEQAAQQVIKNQWLAIESEAYQDDHNINAAAERKRQGEEAEARRLADVEKAKRDEIARQNLEREQAAEAKMKIEANKKHVGAIRGEIKRHIMQSCNLDEATATSVVKALLNIKDRVTINY